MGICMEYYNSLSTHCNSCQESAQQISIKCQNSFLSAHNLLFVAQHTYIKCSYTFVSGHCKECKNFNSMFAVISGLGHGSVTRLRQAWDKLPSKYLKLFEVNHSFILLTDFSL